MTTLTTTRPNRLDHPDSCLECGHSSDCSLHYEPAMPNEPCSCKPWCCALDCVEFARWELYFGASPDDFTQSCEAHVAELLGDSPLLGIAAVEA